MSAQVRFLSESRFHGNIVFAAPVTEWPDDPEVGTFILKDQVLFGYLKIGGLETWYPFASKTNSYVHNQGLPALTWVVAHGLSTENVWLQVKDAAGNIIAVGKTPVDANTFTLNFTTAIAGTCVVVAPDTIDVPEVKASLITVGAAVSIRTDGVYVNGQPVLTSANIEAQIASAVAPKADTTWVATQLAGKSDDSHDHDSRYDALGLAQGLMNGHAAAADPHPQYLTEGDAETTYAALLHTHDYVTPADVETRIQALVGAAPAALDTLQEIAAQLADDESAVAALTTVVAGKASQSTTYTKAEVDAALRTFASQLTWAGLP